MKGLESRLARGGVWMVAMKFGVKVLGFVSTMIVARILTPADYGIVAIAIGIVGIMEVLGELGFDMALIRNREATDAHYNTAWTLNFVRGCIFAVLILLFADVIVGWFNAPQAATLLRFLALVPLLDAITNIGVVNFRKEFQFDRDFKLTLASKGIEICAAISAAVLLRNYWALAIGMIVGQAATVIIGYRMSSYRPRFDMSRWREILGFSGWIFGYNITFAMSWRLDNLMLGRLLPPASVGLFSNSISIAALPSMDLVMPIARVLYPGFSAITADHDRLKRMYLRSLAVTLSVALPLTYGLAALADPVVMVLLGSQWREADEILSVAAAAFGLSMLLSGGDPLLIASGASRALFFRGLIRMIVRPTALYFLVTAHGLAGAGWALWCAIGVDVLIGTYLLQRTLRFSFAEWISELYRPLLATAGMYLALIAVVDSHAPDIAAALGTLAAGVPLGALLYGALLLGLWALHGKPEGFEQSVIGILKSRWARLRGR